MLSLTDRRACQKGQSSSSCCSEAPFLHHWIVLYGYQAGLVMPQYRPLHDCTQSLFSAYFTLS